MLPQPENTRRQDEKHHGTLPPGSDVDLSAFSFRSPEGSSPDAPENHDGKSAGRPAPEENQSAPDRKRRKNTLMQVVSWLLDKSENSKLALFALNRAFLRAIPFNQPHGIAISRVEKDRLEATLPFKRRNQNHIRGLHACALATVSEFVTGVLLSRQIDPTRYRIIMKGIDVDYHYQGKSTATAVAVLDSATVQEKVLGPIERDGAALLEMESNTYDHENNHLATATIRWHIKPWEAVKSKPN